MSLLFANQQLNHISTRDRLDRELHGGLLTESARTHCRNRIAYFPSGLWCVRCVVDTR